jgi:alanine racemase
VNPQTRRSWAEVDAGAIRFNAASLVARIAPVDLCAVVKGDGYGHGIATVAHAAIAGGATWLAVATLDEGICLRNAGITTRMLLLSEPPLSGARELVEHDITPAVYSVEALLEIASAAVEAGRDQPFPIHLKVDTGLHRLGMQPAELFSVVDLLPSLPAVFAEGVFTHFAAASAFDEGFTREQRFRFEEILRTLEQRGFSPAMRHICNSAGTTLSFRATDSMVRAGASLYGIAPTAAATLPALARPALSLKSRVLLARELPAGEALAYGRSVTLDETTVVATVAIGYGDGLPRKAGLLGGELLIGGRRCRIFGPTAMDQVIVDCGPHADVHRGDEVVVIGSQGNETIAVTDWARLLDLSPWEVLTGITSRVPRIVRGASHGRHRDELTGTASNSTN